MTTLSWKYLLPLAAASLIAAGCSGSKKDTSGNPNAQGTGNSPPVMGGGGDERGGGSGLKRAMSRIGKGPQGLDNALTNELKMNPPPWDQIQPQAKEYDELAASLGKETPSKGSKESWDKQTAEFATAAAELDKAAQAKDLNAAEAAQTKLKGSCMACHREHRPQRGPRGG